MPIQYLYPIGDLNSNTGSQQGLYYNNLLQYPFAYTRVSPITPGYYLQFDSGVYNWFANSGERAGDFVFEDIELKPDSINVYNTLRTTSGLADNYIGVKSVEIYSYNPFRLIAHSESGQKVYNPGTGLIEFCSSMIIDDYYMSISPEENSSLSIYTTYQGYIYSGHLQLTKTYVVVSGEYTLQNDAPCCINGHLTTDSGICLYTNGGTYEDSGLELHTHGHTGINSLISIYTKGGTYEDSGISLYIDAFDDSASGLSLFTKGSIHLDSGINLYTSGSQQPFNNTTLYAASIGEQSSGTDLYTQGAYYQDSGLNLHIQRCVKEARLQPLYDNEFSPNPVESGYEGYQSSNSDQYNGIDGQQRWGFRGYLEDNLCTDKLHFSVDDDFFEGVGCESSGDFSGGCSEYYQKDAGYIYSQTPAPGDVGWHGSTQNYVYFYDGYNTDRSVYETHNIIDFHSRGLDLTYGPYDTYLRFRADIDTPFKVKNIYVYDELYNILSQKIGVTELDGYGTCGPYEILLDTQYFSSGTFNPSRTRIYADFYVDTGCLDFIYPTGLTHASQTDNNFRIQYRNHRTYSHWNGSWQQEDFQSGLGIQNLHIEAQDSNSFPENYRSNNTFGYEFSGISDTTSDKYLGLRITDYHISEFSGQSIDITYRIYGNFASGNNYIGQGTFTIGCQPNANFTSGDITYWSQLPDELNYQSGVQVGFYVSKDNFYSDSYEDFDLVLASQPFIYIDTAGQGVDRLGQIKLTQLDVVFEIPCIPTGINDGITLYTAGYVVADSGFTLYTSGGIHESLPLYTSGMYFARSGLEMYIRGAAHGELPLYIKGFGGTESSTSTLYIGSELSGIDYGSISNTLTLFTKSIPLASGDGLNLYIAGPDSGIIRDFGIEMFVEGYGGSQYAGIDLFLNARDSGVQYGYEFNSADLYIPSIPTSSGDMTLYITAPESGYLNESMALFVNNTNAWASKNSGMNLYLRALESGNTNTTLFIKTNEHYDYSGDMSLYMFGTGVFTNTLDMELYISGKSQPDNELDLFLCVASNQNEYFSLYTKGWGDSGIKTATLHTKGFGGREFERTDLFILGPDPSKESGDMTLFIEGGGTDDRNQSTDLYTVGTVTGGYLNSIPMYTVGGFDVAEMPLYLENLQEISLLAGSGTLYVRGFDGTSIDGTSTSSTNLFTGGAPSSNGVSLTIINSGIYGATNNISLSMAGRDIIYDSVNNGCDLTIGNYFNLLSGGLELFMYSQQHYNDSGELNLYMSRSVESSAMRAEMYVSGPVGENNSVNMYINGGTDSYESVTLCLPSSVGSEIRNINMYSHGF